MPDFEEAVVSQLSALVERGEVASVAFGATAGTDVRGGGFGGVDPDSVFQIGSVTKAFTGLLLADSVARGEVEFSDPATDYLLGASPGRVTLVELATHTSGLPRLPPGMLRYALLRPRNPYAWYPESSFLRAAPQVAGDGTWRPAVRVLQLRRGAARPSPRRGRSGSLPATDRGADLLATRHVGHELRCQACSGLQ